MSRPSRLHALERALKAPRKSRAQARALTVMRLDGAGGSPPVTRPARLPRDMEDQIAIVRGRAVGKPSRGLLQLEERLLRPPDVAPTPQTQRNDHGAMPRLAAPASQARALSAQMADSEFGGSYNVESFEDTSGPRPGQLLTTPQTEFCATTAPPPAVPGQRVTAAGVPVVNSGIRPAQDNSFGLSSGASERDRSLRRRALTPDQKAVAANFEQDVAAMLGTPSPAIAPEDEQWNNTVQNAAKTPGVAGAAEVITPPPPPKENAHEVFNQMGVAMNYANSFDLGAMDLSARLDLFDQELALAPKAPARATPPEPNTVKALMLDDFDLIQDLAEITAAQSAPATAVTPAEQFSAQREAPTVAP